MRKLALMAILATVVVTPFAMSWASGSGASDTPECCVKKQGCCPSASCCKRRQSQHGRALHDAHSLALTPFSCS